MSLEHSLSQELLSHFHQYYQCLLSYIKLINALQYETGLQEISFIITHLGSLLGYSRAATGSGKIRYIFIYVTLNFMPKR